MFDYRKRPHSKFYPLVWSLLVKPRRGGVYFIGTNVTDTNGSIMIVPKGA